MGWPQEANGHRPGDNDMLFGQLLERSDQAIWWLRRMDSRMERGDERFSEIEATLAEHSVKHENHETELARLRKEPSESKPSSPLQMVRSALERVQMLQWWAAWIAIIVLSLTGYIAPAELKGLAMKWIENHYSVTPEEPQEHSSSYGSSRDASLGAPS